jgi:dolichol kinase
MRPAFLLGKSIEGSLACFLAVLFTAYQVSSSYRIALFAAITATLAEALPLEDFDNIALPLAVGFVVQLVSSSVI